jgi:TolB protein
MTSCQPIGFIEQRYIPTTTIPQNYFTDKSVKTPERSSTSTLIIINPVHQLTFVSYEGADNLYDIKYSGVFAMNVGCLDQEELCFSEPKLLFKRTGFIYTIEWSPDGSKIAYEMMGSIYIANPNGQNEVQIPTPVGNSSNPHWSLDGKKLAYIFGSETIPYEVLIYDLNTGRSTRTVENASRPMNYYWISKDQVAYIANIDKKDPMSYQIYIATTDGKIEKKFPKNYQDFSSIFQIAFSPEDRQMIFSAYYNEPMRKVRLFYSTLDNDTAVDLPINNQDTNNIGPVWSPSGNWIAFYMSKDKESDIYIMKPDGTKLKKITNNSDNNISPSWRWLQ